MDFDSPQAESYLRALYSATDGNVETVVSMYDIGIPLGLERAEAGALAEELMVEGLVELRNLSGGISITAQALKALDIQVATPAGNEKVLGEDIFLSAEAREAVEEMAEFARAETASLRGDYGHLEELVIDLKSLEVQLLSPRPKTAILREILRSVTASLADGGNNSAAERIERFIG